MSRKRPTDSSEANDERGLPKKGKSNDEVDRRGEHDRFEEIIKMMEKKFEEKDEMWKEKLEKSEETLKKEFKTKEDAMKKKFATKQEMMKKEIEKMKNRIQSMETRRENEESQVDVKIDLKLEGVKKSLICTGNILGEHVKDIKELKDEQKNILKDLENVVHESGRNKAKIGRIQPNVELLMHKCELCSGRHLPEKCQRYSTHSQRAYRLHELNLCSTCLKKDRHRDGVKHRCDDHPCTECSGLGHHVLLCKLTFNHTTK